MGTEITRYAPPVDELKQTAELLAMSNYFDAKGNTPQAVAQIATKILAGRELGYGPFTSVNGIHIIQGRPAISANLMAAAVKASGRYDYRVRQMTNEVVSIEFFQLVAGEMESVGISTFTAQDARAAGTQNMAKFARNMLFARAMSNGVKWYCPDVFNGNTVYTPEELGADVDGEGNVIDVTPKIVTNGGATQSPPVVVSPQPNDSIPADSHGTGNGTDHGAGNGNGGTNGKAATAEMFKRYAAAKEAAQKSGKFASNKHLENAWGKLFKEHAAHDPTNADAFLAAWAEYVEAHVPEGEAVPA